MPIKFISDTNLKKHKGKTAIVRVDLNIESNEVFSVNHPRINSILPTINLLLKNKIRVILLSHRGRPDHSKVISGQNKKFSLGPIVPFLKKRLKTNVQFVPVFDFSEVEQKINTFKKTSVFLLENIRFLEGEEKNSIDFARKLAKLGDFYINEAFAVSHRKNASTLAITKFLPSYGGLLFKAEIKNLDKVIKSPKKPFTIIIGGAKISDKINVVKNLWEKADYFLLGGGPANTFFSAQGLDMKSSLVDEDYKIKIKRYLNSKKIFLPVDLKTSKNKILDIGPKTIELYEDIILKSKTIIWNGPMGFFEKRGFEKGTFGIWDAIFKLTKKNKSARIIVGGGETIASLCKPNKSERVFISTGGGAMLLYLSGKKLPGIKALENHG